MLLMKYDIATNIIDTTSIYSNPFKINADAYQQRCYRDDNGVEVITHSARIHISFTFEPYPNGLIITGQPNFHLVFYVKSHEVNSPLNNSNLVITSSNFACPLTFEEDAKNHDISKVVRDNSSNSPNQKKKVNLCCNLQKNSLPYYMCIDSSGLHESKHLVILEMPICKKIQNEDHN